MTPRANVAIDSGAGSDTISIESSTSVTAYGGDGDDTIVGYQSNKLYIHGGAGNDSINIAGSNADNINTIAGGEGDDTITGGRGLHLYQYTEGDGNDIITDFKANDTLQIGNGTDTYNSIKSGSDIIVTVGDGSVTLKDAAGLSAVNIAGTYVDPLLRIGTDGDDYIVNSLDGATILALGGNDSITNNGSNVLIDAGEDDDSVSIGYWDNKSVGSNVTVNLGVGDDYFSNYGFQKISVSGGAGNDYIDNNALSGVEYITPDNSTLLGGAGDDTIINAGVNTSISGGTGDDYINNWGNDVIIDSGEGNDYIESYGFNSTLDGGDGDDTISNKYNDNSFIDGGAGNDSIYSDDGDHSTINSGAGNDSIRLGSYASNNLIQYTSGDGNDIVRGFNETSTLQIGNGTDTYNSIKSGSDIIVTVGTSAVTLEGAANLSAVNIAGTYINPLLIVGTDKADNISNDLDNATIQALGGNDSITNSGSNVTIDGGDDNDSIRNWSDSVSIDAGAGDDLISNSGDSVTIDGGDSSDTIDNEGSNVTIDSGSGDDSISNSGDSVTIDGGDGDDYIYTYKGTNGSINGGAGNDSISNSNMLRWNSETSIYEIITPDFATLLGGDGDDSIYNSGENVSIDGGAGNDSIQNGVIASGGYDVGGGHYSSIGSGAGNDYIQNSGGANVSIDGGDGSDSISNSNRVIWNSETSTYETITPDFATIIGGKGHDKIFNGGENVLFKYSADDGNDIINGFNETSTLQIGDGTGEFESVVSGSDVIITVGNGSVTLKDAAGLSAVNILGKEIVSGPKTLYLDDSDKSPVTLSSDYQHADASARVRKAIKIAGNEQDNSIIGGDKNDSLVGKDGNDTLIGGFGNDTFTGGNGNDLFVYIAGNDVVTDYVSGQDTIKFESAITNVSVKSSDVIFTTADGKITVKNSDGKKINFIDVSGNASVYPSGKGFTVEGTMATIFEEYPEDLFDAAEHSTKIKTIDASATTHDLEIFSNDLASKIIGGDGDNILHGSTKNDTFTGGVGNDTFVYSGGNDTITDYTEDEDIIDIESGAAYSKASVKGNDVIFTVGKGKITVKDAADKTIMFSDGTTYPTKKGGGFVTLINPDPSPYILGATIETVDGTKRTKAIEIFGNDLDNSIVSGSKNDSIYSGDGDDTLDGAKGNDTLTGGDGNDVFVYTAGKDVITDYNEDEDIISLAVGTIKTASVKGSDVVFKIGSGTLTVNDATGKTLSMIDADGNEFSTVVGGGVETLKIVTNDYPSFVTLAFEVEVVDATKCMKHDVTIEGNAQNNSIVGGSKNDSIYGAAGDDTLNGGKGNDTLTGGDGNDVFVYTAGKDVITDYSDGDKISTSTIKNASAEGDDVVFKIGSGTLTVTDAAGKTLTMIDAKGNEYSMIIGGGEEPPVSLNAAGTAVTIFEGYTADSFDAADYGSKLKTIDGSATTHDFEIIGNGLANSIIGGSGDNILIGGLGNDKLWGNEGNDTFIYEDGDGKDVIYGFEDGDLLQITGNFSAKFNQSKNEIAFKVGTTSNAITLKEFDATTFNINGDSYQISGTKLVKK